MSVCHYVFSDGCVMNGWMYVCMYAGLLQEEDGVAKAVQLLHQHASSSSSGRQEEEEEKDLLS